MYNLKDGAIFVADSHFAQDKQQFLEFLEYIDALETKPVQMIFLGDNFDLLVGQIKEHKYKYHYILKLINDLSKEIEIIYFEGNHDFNLKVFFPNIDVIPIQKQPLLFQDDSSNFIFSHGDCYGSASYDIFAKIIRSSIVVRVLSLFDFSYFFIKKIEDKLSKKSICGKWDLSQVAKKRVKLFNEMFNPIFGKIDFVVEGHFHQSGKYKFDTDNTKDTATTYIATPSLHCSSEVVIYENKSFIKKKFYDI
jgi:UDP-2,3-diacylglucosamine hydrolase